MARNGPGPADRELIATLAEQDLRVSVAQLERWRGAGLLPRHERRWLGRGRGSVAVLAPATVRIAAVLARHARQGRDLRWAVLDWFAEAGRDPDMPEPPDHAVCQAVPWAAQASPAQRLLRQARDARTEHLQDAFYTAAGATVPSGALGVDPAAMRAILLGGDDLPPESAARDEGQGLVHLIAAPGMGFDEVGADALGMAFAATGLVPQMTAENWSSSIQDMEPAGILHGPLARAARTYAFADGRDATAEDLRAARTVYYGLAGVGGLLMWHALGVPDTPTQQALRATVEEMGIASWLMAMAAGSRPPSTFAGNVVTCLRPDLARVHDALIEQITSSPSLMDRSGGQEPHDPDQFMKDWIATLTALT
ncbi:hypothetical protein ABZZ36_38140 [Actinacidiphila glaucinigra]|uniref:hypothetical protein n=1 Tax=Actinacidiphila glaucinigra TaxID=235986 RepID=UPI0033A27F8C